MSVGCYPGSFNPLTIAHLAIASAARHTFRLERVDLVLSRVALGKENVERARWQDRFAVLERAAASRPWLGAVATDGQLLVEIAAGYDALVLGADKWAQVLDPSFYGGSVETRDAAVAALPPLAIVRRPGTHVEVPAGATVLVLPAALEEASSTSVRLGRAEWMAPEAAEFAARTGAWLDPLRYESWLADKPANPRGAEPRNPTTTSRRGRRQHTTVNGIRHSGGPRSGGCSTTH